MASELPAVQRVVAFDEGRCGLKTPCRRRWCPLEVRPPWVVDDAYEWWWAYVSSEPRTGHGTALLLPGVDHRWLQVDVEHVAQQFGSDRVGIVLDNAPSHHRRTISWPATLHPIFLPPNSPELNPAEHVFKEWRQRLSNVISDSLDAWQEALIGELQRFWDHPEVVIRFAHYPWWEAAEDAMLPLLS